MGQANQIYSKWKRLLLNPSNPKELYLVLEKDKPMSIETIKSFEERFRDCDIIITITKLIRKKHTKTKQMKEV